MREGEQGRERRIGSKCSLEPGPFTQFFFLAAMEKNHCEKLRGRLGFKASLNKGDQTTHH